MGRRAMSVLAAAAALAVAGCAITPSGAQEPTPTASATATPVRPTASATPGPTLLGLVTDYGTCDPQEQVVATMVRGWPVSAILTAGDNTQNRGDCVPFEQSVWTFYDRGPDGTGKPTFWPALGNHDYEDAGAGLDAYRKAFPYLSADADPQQRWYSEDLGHVRVFMVDSEVAGPDVEAQRQWLKTSLRASRARDPHVWNLVIVHRPPFTSGTHAAHVAMRPQPESNWNYQAWGADLVVSGHQHIYEDVVVGGFHYLTAGIGASDPERSCPTERVPDSRVCRSGPGAVRILATSASLTVEYHQPTVPGESRLTDTFTLKH